MPRVMVTPPELVRTSTPCHELFRAAGFEIVHPPEGMKLFQEDLLIEHLQGVDAMLAGMEPFTRRVLASTKLRAIARFGVGYDAIDVPAATDLGVVVNIAAGANQVCVAEHMLALLLSVFRCTPQRDRKLRAGIWQRQVVPRLAGRTLGLVGCGRIGKEVTTRAQGLGLNVIVYDPFPDTAFTEKHNVRLCSLDELLAEADIVSLHLPGTPATKDMFSAARFAQMKPGSVFINTARGSLVNEDALVAALESGHLWAAGLDTFVVEPLPATSPLCRLENVVLTPHNGGIDEQAVLDVSLAAARAIVELHEGRWPDQYVVNKELKPGWKW
jgi:D-3-phosphoglycerate dehydrogenase / 2-oxoglutarate reductase